MDANFFTKIINSAGLCFDISGAGFVAYEVVQQFKGPKYEASSAGAGIDPPPTETAAFTTWERTKYKRMKLGLILLVIGFVLQLLSNWPCLFYGLFPNLFEKS